VFPLIDATLVFQSHRTHFFEDKDKFLVENADTDSPVRLVRLCCGVLRKNNVLQYEDVEVRVRDATSSDAWGASGTLMRQIADDTYHRSGCSYFPY